MESFIPSSIALGVMFVGSAVLSMSRARIPDGQLKSVSTLVLMACGAQLLHFLEEAAFGLHARLPQAFGFPEMPFSFFLSINIGALVIWMLGALQQASNRLAVTTYWFLGLASLFNLVAHPALAILSGGYFPGVVTSPLVGITGFLLARRLFQVTAGGLRPAAP